MSFIGVVLAGGRSSRMGSDKALLTIDGETLLGRGTATLRAAGAQRVVVSGTYAGHECVVDAVSGAGPVGGIASVLQALPDATVVFVPVDMPLLDARLLTRLIEAAQESAGAAFRASPLPWVVHANDRVRSLACELLAEPSRARSVRTLQDKVGTHAVDVSPEDAWRIGNFNTPVEWRECERRVSG